MGEIQLLFTNTKGKRDQQQTTSQYPKAYNTTTTLASAPVHWNKQLNTHYLSNTSYFPYCHCNTLVTIPSITSTQWQNEYLQLPIIAKTILTCVSLSSLSFIFPQDSQYSRVRSMWWIATVRAERSVTLIFEYLEFIVLYSE